MPLLRHSDFLLMINRVNNARFGPFERRHRLIKPLSRDALLSKELPDWEDEVFMDLVRCVVNVLPFFKLEASLDL